MLKISIWRSAGRGDRLPWEVAGRSPRLKICAGYWRVRRKVDVWGMMFGNDRGKNGSGISRGCDVRAFDPMEYLSLSEPCNALDQKEVNRLTSCSLFEMRRTGRENGEFLEGMKQKVHIISGAACITRK